MSELYNLITALCPEGVEYKPLEEVGTFIRGNGLQKSDFTDRGVGCIHYGQVYTYYGLFAYQTKSFVSIELAKKLRKAHNGDLVIATTSENIDDVCKAVAWLGEEDIAISGDSYVVRHNLDPKYVAYFFSSAYFQKQKRPFVTGTKVMRVSDVGMSKIEIPVPPIEVQRKIVEILDNFSELTAELTAELTSRQKQYQYYRDNILNFSGITTPPHRENDVIKRLKLSSLVSITTGKLNANAMAENGKYPFFTCDSEVYRINEYAFDEEAILVSGNGSQVGHIHYYKGKFNAYQRTYVLYGINDNVNTQYLLFYLKAFLKEHIIKLAKKGSVPYITLPMLADFSIPIPSIKEQNRIVGILRHFDFYNNDLSLGLPAEIKARQQQYEYYRDKLLTFKRKTVA